MKKRFKIAIVLEPVAARRLSGMMTYFRPDKEYCLIDVLRPLPELIEKLGDFKPDGIVTRVAPGVTEALTDLGIPTVVVGGTTCAKNVFSVRIDNESVGRMAAHYLLDLGHTRFAVVGNRSYFSEGRRLGFEEVLKEQGFAVERYVEQPHDWNRYLELLPRHDRSFSDWVEGLQKPIGVFSTHDTLGWHLSKTCQDGEIPVPESVSILSANNDMMICELTNPPLSSVAIPWDKMSAEVAMIMDSLIDIAQGMEVLLDLKSPRNIYPEGVVSRRSSDYMAFESPVLLKAIRFINDHFHEGIDVSDVVAEVPVSRRKLETEFMKALGRAPKAEIVRVRIGRAKELLVRTELKMPLVSERCGYSYVERFTVSFKKNTGFTPSEYRKRFRV